MNKANVPTEKKVAFTLRLTPSTYKLIRAKVNEIKDNENFSYSINDYLTEIIEKELKHKKRL